MLSNHSLPAAAKTARAAELLSAPNLLGAVLRAALPEDSAMSSTDAANYRYWQDEGWYVGRLKGLPGVFSQGKTLSELEENIQDAYRNMVEDEGDGASC